ncbi:DUF401 family protein [Dysosmobacter sp.]|uniref:DUF401 family protein n=1 Tax=Dysosmobacter sp. TaxID=2591382 RepID=UPI002A8A0AF9|nr:DUF401 family protein [Dysosmobacter sp.]MDY3282697.1 DUF401 family protein [Dysosmobacter sp.]
MELIKVAVVFFVILAVLNRRLPLYAGMLAGTAVTLALFAIPPAAFAAAAAKALTGWDTWDVVLAMYVISVLQVSLDHRRHLENAQRAMAGLFHDQRLNAALASVFIGTMPAAPAVTICGRIIDNMAGDHLTPAEKAACASFFRHIPEGFLPTFSIILIVTSLSGVPMASFVAVMLPMAAVLVAIGFAVYLRRIPRSVPERAAGKAESLRLLLRSLWTIAAIIAVILIFGLPASLATALVTAVNFRTDRFSPSEVRRTLVRGFDWKITVGMISIFVFKEVLVATGVIDRLPDYFARLPIPTFLTLALLFFFGTLVGSSTAAGTAFTPLAFAALPGGASLLVLLVGFSWGASQLSPTHLCMAVACQDFGVPMTAFIRKTILPVLIFLVVITGYYLLLTALGL